MAEGLVSISKALGSTEKGEGKNSYLSHGNFRADPWEVRPGDLDGHMREERTLQNGTAHSGRGRFLWSWHGQRQGKEMRNGAREVSSLVRALA